MSNLPDWTALGTEARATAEAKAAHLWDEKQARAASFAESNPDVVEGFKRAQKVLLEVMAHCQRIAEEFNASAFIPELRLRVNPSQQLVEPANMISFELWKGEGSQLSTFMILRSGEVTVRTYSKNRPFAGHTDTYLVQTGGQIFLNGTTAPLTSPGISAATCERLIKLQDV